LLSVAFKRYMENKSMPIRWIKIVFTFHLAVFAWIFFRAKNLTDAKVIIYKIFNISNYSIQDVHLLSVMKLATILLTVFLLFLFILSDVKMDGFIKNRLVMKSKFFNMALYALILVFILLFGYFGQTDFIYFQF